MQSFKSSTPLKLAALASMLFAGSAFADATYLTDQGHTEVRFSWSHAGVTIQTGEFEEASGKATLADDLENSTLEVTINPASLDTGFKALDDELKTEAFFNVETYPEITFKSTSVVKTGETTMDVVGDLTMHGITKEVTLQGEITLQGEHPLGGTFDYYKGEWIAINATTEIDHQAFGIGPFSTGPITVEIVSEMKAES